MDDTEIGFAALACQASPRLRKPQDAEQMSKIMSTHIEKLGLDSLESMELIMTIEDTYSIVLEEDDVLRCESLGDLFAIVKSASPVSA